MAQRATSLGPKPSLFSFCFFWFLFFFFAFLSLFFKRQKTVFPLEKGIFCLFSMFLFLSPLTFFGLPLLLFLFLCLSLSLVFLSSFLSFFLLSFCFLFLSLFHFSFFFAFVSWKEQHEHFQLQFLFSWNSFSFFWFPVLLFLSDPFFLSLLFFLILSYVFCSTSMLLVSKKTKLRNTNFLSKGELQQNGFFLWTCVLENVKSYRLFLPIFCQILVDVQKTL